eukprot:evm.model.scf_271.6 EVM.evm.TU.scf_271.6   scf_271:84205-86942(-)
MQPSFLHPELHFQGQVPPIPSPGRGDPAGPSVEALRTALDGIEEAVRRRTESVLATGQGDWAHGGGPQDLEEARRKFREVKIQWHEAHSGWGQAIANGAPTGEEESILAQLGEVVGPREELNAAKSRLSDQRNEVMAALEEQLNLLEGVEREVGKGRAVLRAMLEAPRGDSGRDLEALAKRQRELQAELDRKLKVGVHLTSQAQQTEQRGQHLLEELDRDNSKLSNLATQKEHLLAMARDKQQAIAKAEHRHRETVKYGDRITSVVNSLCGQELVAVRRDCVQIRLVTSLVDKENVTPSFVEHLLELSLDPVSCAVRSARLEPADVDVSDVEGGPGDLMALVARVSRKVRLAVTARDGVMRI